MKKIIYLIILLIAFTLVGCNNEVNLKIKEHQNDLYQFTVELGYKKDIKEWIETYYKDKFELFDLSNIVKLGVFQNNISISYKDYNGYTISKVLTTIGDLIDPDNEHSDKIVKYTVEDYIIKWKYENDDNWNDLISLEKLAFPINEPNYEVEYEVYNKYRIVVKYENPLDYVQIADLSLLMGNEENLRDNYRFGEFELNEEIEAIGCTLIPAYDEAWFITKSSGNYTISNSNSSAKIRIYNNELSQNGYGSLSVYLEKDVHINILIETITYSDYNSTNSSYKIKIEMN